MRIIYISVIFIFSFVFSEDEFEVTWAGASGWAGYITYIINGNNDPSLTLIKGQTYYFDINTVGHPLQIEYLDGTVIAGPVEDDILIFTVPNDLSSDILRYICQYGCNHISSWQHNCWGSSSPWGMEGEINIIDAPLIVPDYYSSIQSALTAASEGDTVLVQPGTYYENIIWPETNGIKLIGSGEDDCIIDGNQEASVIRFEEDLEGIIDSTTLITGFTIQNASGGGMHLYFSSPALTDVTFRGNSNCGMHLKGSSPTLTGVIFINNTAEEGGGMYLYDSSPTLTGVIFINNTAEEGGGMYLNYNSNPTLTNSILWGSSPQEIYFLEIDSPISITISYSDIQGGEESIITSNNGIVNWLAGNIDADPLFCDAENGDLTLAENSPCVGTGQDGANMGALGIGCTDLILGCQDESACNYDVNANIDNGSCKYCLCQTCSDNGTCLDFGFNYICICNSFYTGTNCETDIDECATDNGGCGDATYYTCTNNVGAAATCVYVPQILNVPNEYSTIQSAIDASLKGETVLVAAGTYTENIDYGGKNIVVISSDGPITTIIKPNYNMQPIVYFHNNETINSILSGFTLSDGGPLRGSAIKISEANPTINNCIIKNCILTNTAYGAISFHTTQSEIKNTIIYGTIGGPAIYVDNVGDNSTLTNCTIVNNDIGIELSDRPLNVKNSIIFNNSINLQSYGFLTIEYSNIEGGYTGNGNIDTDPLFCNPTTQNYSIAQNSPCVGNGENGVNMGALGVGCTEPAVYGCITTTACNYNQNANTDDGSCTYAEQYYNCDGNCITDTDADTVCNELEVSGCTVESACNYNADATDSDDCTYPETYYNCDGSCINDTDGNGVCDELDVVFTMSVVNQNGVVQNHFDYIESYLGPAGDELIWIKVDYENVPYWNGACFQVDLPHLPIPEDRIFCFPEWTDGGPEDDNKWYCPSTAGSVAAHYYQGSGGQFDTQDECENGDWNNGGGCLKNGGPSCINEFSVYFDITADVFNWACGSEGTIDLYPFFLYWPSGQTTTCNGIAGSCTDCGITEQDCTLTAEIRQGCIDSPILSDGCQYGGACTCLTCSTLCGTCTIGSHTNETDCKNAGGDFTSACDGWEGNIFVDPPPDECADLGFYNPQAGWDYCGSVCCTGDNMGFGNFCECTDGCIYPETYYNCDGSCIWDDDGDGVCNGLEVLGCQDEAACNYNGTATDDDGSCEYPEDFEWCDCDGNVEDCAGECGGTAQVDECSTCDSDSSNDNTPLTGTCDCAGTPYGDATIDNCGTCDSDSSNDCVKDCADVWGGTATSDNCGICDSDSSNDCVQDCTGIWGGSSVLDECGVCNGDNLTCTGCMDETACNYNDCNGDGVLDDPCTIEDIQLCSYPEEVYLNCDGSCINDSNGDGVCDELSLFNGLIPEDFSIHNIYPNPFNPVTNIIYGLPEHVNVQIMVYDISGKQVETLINQFQTPGYHSVSWNADNHHSGVYFVKIVAGDYINTQKLMLVK